MITTFNGCYRSEIKVTPANWRTTKASVKVPWRIHYRFYDPEFKDHPKLKKGKQGLIRGMNHVNTLEERQAITKKLIDDEKNLLDSLGFNPITEIYMAPAEPAEIQPVEQEEITSETGLIKALRLALKCISPDPENDKSGIDEDTVTDMNSVLKYFERSAIKLIKAALPLKDVQRRDITQILDNCKNLTVTKVINKKVLVNDKWKVEKEMKFGKMAPVKVEISIPKIWTENQFNHYRKYLLILYSELERQEVVEYNPIEKIPVKDTAPEDPDSSQRKFLELQLRKEIDMSLRINYPEFHRLVNIFFHSGARRKEIMKVQGRHVDLPGQRFKVLVNKGKKRWVWKPIKDIALPFWVEALKGCGPEDYVFSIGLTPGLKPINAKQVTRRWNEHIKKKLGIDKNFYWLKHTHTTEIRTELEKVIPEQQALQQVADHNSHTSGAMVVKIYDVDNDKREHKKVKGIKNSFAG